MVDPLELTLDAVLAANPKNVEALEFASEAASARKAIAEMKQEGAQVIVALTHIGNERDLALAAKVNGLDAIVGGHSHSLLGDFRNIGWGKTGEYAQVVTNPDGVGLTCVVQAGSYAQTIGLDALTKIADTLREDCVIIQEPKMEGRQLVMFVGPKAER